MKTILLILVIMGMGWVYLNRDQLFTENESVYCKSWRETLEADEYAVRYGDRVKAITRGCF